MERLDTTARGEIGRTRILPSGPTIKFNFRLLLTDRYGGRSKSWLCDQLLRREQSRLAMVVYERSTFERSPSFKVSLTTDRSDYERSLVSAVNGRRLTAPQRSGLRLGRTSPATDCAGVAPISASAILAPTIDCALVLGDLRL